MAVIVGVAVGIAVYLILRLVAHITGEDATWEPYSSDGSDCGD